MDKETAATDKCSPNVENTGSDTGSSDAPEEMSGKNDD